MFLFWFVVWALYKNTNCKMNGIEIDYIRQQVDDLTVKFIVKQYNEEMSFLDFFLHLM